MNRYFALGCLGLGLMVSPLLARVSSSAVPASPKIAVISIDETMSKTPAAKRALEAFQKTLKAKQGVLDKQQEELRLALESLEKRKVALKPEAYEAERQVQQKKLGELKQVYVKLEEELDAEQRKLFNDLLAPKIAALAKAEGVSLILDKRFTLWAEPTLDLTEKLNAEMK